MEDEKIINQPEGYWLHLFEPDLETVLGATIPRILEAQLYQALLESVASEHAARMIEYFSFMAGCHGHESGIYHGPRGDVNHSSACHIDSGTGNEYCSRLTVSDHVPGKEYNG